jgi:hypothetical protein
VRSDVFGSDVPGSGVLFSDVLWMLDEQWECLALVGSDGRSDVLGSDVLVRSDVQRWSDVLVWSDVQRWIT